MSKFYLYDGETWIPDDKRMRFVKLSDRSESVAFTSLDPDSLEKFVEVVHDPKSYVRNSPKEKLYRVITDIHTVSFLSEDSFRDISRNVLNYLQEREEWERMCVIRDMGKYYWRYRENKTALIDEEIRKHDKPAANEGC